MKKKIALFTLLVAATAALTACGDKVNAGKYVTLGEYKGIAVSVAPKEAVTESDIDNYIMEALQSKTTYTEVTDRAVQEGDNVNIDYVGTKDGVEFQGGSTDGAGYDLVIGSNRLIEGFEEGLIGAEKGANLDLNLTFPENYKSEELAGQAVVFNVTVNSIQESVIPELKDEIVPTLAPDCNTVAEYKEYVRTLLEDNAQSAYDQSAQNAAFDIVYKSSEVTEPPKELVDSYVVKNDQNTELYASQFGLSKDDFIKNMLNQTVEEFDKEKLVRSEEAAKQELAVRAIAEKEKIKVKDNEINTFAEENMAQYGYETAEKLLEGIGSEEIEFYLLRQKVLEVLVENATVTDQTAADNAEEPSAGDTGTEAAAEEDTAASQPSEAAE